MTIGVSVIIKSTDNEFDIVYVDGTVPRYYLNKINVKAIVIFEDGTELNGEYTFNNSFGQKNFRDIRMRIASLLNAELIE
jgi:hypothetical protein